MTDPSSAAELAGRVALVTGAARNIGRAIARELAAGGASVIVNARSAWGDAETVAADIRAEGGEAMAFVADVTDPDAVARMVDAAVARYGRFRANAGQRHVIGRDHP